MEKPKKKQSFHEMSDSDSDRDEPVKQKAQVTPLKNISIHEMSDSDDEPQPSSSSSIKRKSSGSQPNSASKKLKMEDRRPMCRYGDQCYRKNPSHYKDFRHPGMNKLNIYNLYI